MKRNRLRRTGSKRVRQEKFIGLCPPSNGRLGPYSVRPRKPPGVNSVLTFLSCGQNIAVRPLTPVALDCFARGAACVARNFPVTRRGAGYVGETYSRKAGTIRNGIIPRITLASAKTSRRL